MNLSPARLKDLEGILREAAQAEVLPRFRNAARQAVRTKTSHLDVVTEADEAAERLIAARLATLFPAALVVGEEATAADPGLLDRIADAELSVLVDPIDGTKNYASGLPLFAVMAAVVNRGETVGGVIHDPIADISIFALRGGGAWLTTGAGDRLSLHLPKPPALPDMLGIVSWTFMPEPMRSRMLRNMGCVAGAADYRSVAHHYRLIAEGNYDFLVFGKVMPWDHAAGCLVVEELGGVCALLDGTRYRPTLHAGGLMCAPDRATWDQLHDALLRE